MASTFFGRLFGAQPKPASENLESLESLESRANRGEAAAQFGLGFKFANQSATPDYAQAAHWYLKAAEQSHCLAQFNLGMMHEIGQGMPPDAAKALVWMETAARLGDAGAQFKLGQKHHRASFGVPAEPAAQSRIEAYKWLHLAAVQGYAGSEAARGFVSLNMTIADVTEGTRQAVAFVPGNAASH
jgi:TPR repeat protein